MLDEEVHRKIAAKIGIDLIWMLREKGGDAMDAIQVFQKIFFLFTIGFGTPPAGSEAESLFNENLRILQEEIPEGQVDHTAEAAGSSTDALPHQK